MKLFHLLILIISCLAFSSCQTFFPECVPLDSCGGLTSGLYPSCTNCSKFVACTVGIYTIVPCASNTMYNPSTGMCDTSGTCNLESLVTANTPNPNPSVTHDNKPTTSTTTTTTTTMSTTSSTTTTTQTSTTTTTPTSTTSSTTTTIPTSTTTTTTTSTSTTTSSTTTSPSTTTSTTVRTTTTVATSATTTTTPTTTTIAIAATSTTTTITTTTPTTITSTPTTTTTTIKQNKSKNVVVKNGRDFVKKIIFQTGCIWNCYGHAFGYFPSCQACDKVVICKPYLNRIASCYYGSKWDDHNKCCQQFTSTCHEITTYTPRQNNFFGYGWW